jgi:hypothetical protein
VANTATGIILVAGGMTFANEWYVTGKPHWRVLVATALAGAIFDGLAHLDSNAAVALSVIVLIGAFTHKVNGQSVSDSVAKMFSQATTEQKKQPRRLQVA